MPLSSESVGASREPVEAHLDARWTMAYAAGLGDTTRAYFDTVERADVVAHPLFPVCFEWPVLLDAGALVMESGLAVEERVRGVHATHDLVLHRPLRAGDRLWTRARVVRVERRRSGAYQVVRLDTADTAGAPVCTTWYGSLYRGVEVAGADRSDDTGAPDPAAPSGDLAGADEVALPLDAGAAHVYTECARIWNPIHTDAAVAARAGLPEIILHGTATLALAVTTLVARCLEGDATRVARVAARFAAMVTLPSTLRVRFGEATSGNGIAFDVRNGEGAQAVREGFVGIRGAL